jgi:hypothetical protein
MASATLAIAALLVAFVVPVFAADVGPRARIGEWEGQWMTKAVFTIDGARMQGIAESKSSNYAQEIPLGRKK